METDSNPVLLISFSGGRTSAFMTKFIYTRAEFDNFKKIVVFANTGKEREETLEFVNECDKRWSFKTVWIESVCHHDERKGSTHRVVDFKNASRNGEPFESMIQKYGIPNQAFPHCTRELKLNPIKSYMRSIGHSDYFSAIGIRFDEPARISRHPKYIYPMYSNLVTNTEIRDFWNKQDFDLRLKNYEVNCDFCWKKSIRKLRTLVQDDPKIVNWWVEMEEKYSENSQYNFQRGNKKTKDLLNQVEPFIRADDPDYKFDPMIDTEKPCSCRTILSEEA
jgi:3'-phosphoadenosine 5'-phosphosulfate sulfotransferase (PAPS reductase)/FAD synthetase